MTMRLDMPLKLNICTVINDVALLDNRIDSVPFTRVLVRSATSIDKHSIVGSTSIFLLPVTSIHLSCPIK